MQYSAYSASVYLQPHDRGGQKISNIDSLALPNNIQFFVEASKRVVTELGIRSDLKYERLWPSNHTVKASVATHPVKKLRPVLASR
jgi:hypothetical protein